MKPHGNYVLVSNHVLVKYGPVKPIYNVVTAGDWKMWERRQITVGANAAYWEEVARGTHAEMEALAKLMPDPKTLSFD